MKPQVGALWVARAGLNRFAFVADKAIVGLLPTMETGSRRLDLAA